MRFFSSLSIFSRVLLFLRPACIYSSGCNSDRFRFIRFQYFVNFFKILRACASLSHSQSLSSLSFLCGFFLSRDLLRSRLFDRRLRSERSRLRDLSLLISRTVRASGFVYSTSKLLQFFILKVTNVETDVSYVIYLRDEPRSRSRSRSRSRYRSRSLRRSRSDGDSSAQ